MAEPSSAKAGKAKENGKKKEPVGGAAQEGGASGILSAEAFTHGGVRKTKFEPKVPTRRLKKLSALVKSEPGDDGALDGETPKELQRLLQLSEDAAARGSQRPDRRGPARVAFGFGSEAAHGIAPPVGFHRPSHGGGGGGGSHGGGGAARGVEKMEFMQVDSAGGGGRSATDSKKGILKNVEVFDLERYFPVTLPLRKPHAGHSTILNEEEFGDEEAAAHDEDEVEAARELDLVERRDNDMLFFFQIPAALPQSVSTAGKENDVHSGAAQLDKLPRGAMGKLVVYESGAVKLKLGDVILDALPGTECMFAQELAAVNTVSKHCCFLGDVKKRIVLTPDVSNVISGAADLQHSHSS